MSKCNCTWVFPFYAPLFISKFFLLFFTPPTFIWQQQLVCRLIFYTQNVIRLKYKTSPWIKPREWGRSSYVSHVHHLGLMITKVITIHPEENTNKLTTFHGNPSDSCWDISLKSLDLMVALQEMSAGIIKVITIHPLGSVNVCTIFHDNLSSRCWDISVWTMNSLKLWRWLIQSLTLCLFLYSQSYNKYALTVFLCTQKLPICHCSCEIFNPSWIQIGCLTVNITNQTH